MFGVWGAGPRFLKDKIMPLLFINIRNSKFHSCDDGNQYNNPEDALVVGLQNAAALLADEVNRGECSAAIEISVEQKDGVRVLCSVMAISVSSMMIPILRPSKLRIVEN